MTINGLTSHARALAATTGNELQQRKPDQQLAEHEARMKRCQTENEELASQVAQFRQDLDDSRKEVATLKDLLQHLDGELQAHFKRLTFILSDENATTLKNFAIGAHACADVTDARGALIKFQSQFNDSGHTALVAVPADVRDSDEVSRLGQGHGATVYGRATFKALMALAEYAKAVERGTNQGRKSFQEWCQAHPDDWAHHLVALSESKSVERDPRLRDQRIFPIDQAVNLSGHNDVGQPGKAYMGAHIKLKQGEDAPRLYFYDDTGVNSRGNPKTGKVYVGYVGPHLDTSRRN